VYEKNSAWAANGKADYSLIITSSSLCGEVISLSKQYQTAYWGTAGGLSMTECDSAFGEIVRGEFQSDFIARQDADAITAEPARQMCQYYPLVFQLHAEQTAGKLF
jgi:hypothetical protein